MKVDTDQMDINITITTIHKESRMSFTTGIFLKSWKMKKR